MKTPALTSLKAAGTRLLPAVLLLLAAAWFAWAGWKAAQAEALAGEAASARAAVAAEIGDAVEQAKAKLEATRVRIALGTALQREDMDSARDLVTSGWDGVEKVEWHAPGLDEAYAQPAKFGFGKIGLLEQALQKNSAEAAIVRDARGPKLAIAAPVVSDG